MTTESAPGTDPTSSQAAATSNQAAPGSEQVAPVSDQGGVRVEPPVLPEQTTDDMDAEWAQAGRAADSDGWAERADDDERFLRERPPHWE